MTFTGDEMFYFFVVPLILALLIYAAFIDVRYGNPYAKEKS